MTDSGGVQAARMDGLVSDVKANLTEAALKDVRVYWYARPGKVARIFVERYTSSTRQAGERVE